MTVTKSMLERLRSRRARPSACLDYTIGGQAEKRVVAQLHIQLEHQIAEGERTFKTTHEAFQTQQAFASRKGLARAHFNHLKKEIKP